MRIYIRELFSMTVCLPVLLLSCAGKEAKRYTAEEAGYWNGALEIGIAQGSCVIGTTVTVTHSVPRFYNPGRSPWSPSRRVETEQVYVDSLESSPLHLGARNWVALGQKLETILPPAALADFHLAARALIAEQAQLSGLPEFHSGSDAGVVSRRSANGAPPSGEELKAEALREALRIRAQEACAAYEGYLEVVNARDELDVQGPDHRLMFRPHLSPVSAGLSSEQGFAVDVDLSIPTPIGDVSYERIESKGVRRLIVRSDGMSRHFMLDRPFSLFVPSDYGVSVSNPEVDTLLIEVVQRAGDIRG
jgi:hypothetical protein